MKKPGNRIKRWGFGPAFFFGLITVSQPGLANYEVFGGFATTLVSEPESVKTTLDDWGSEFTSGERQWALARLEAGVRMDSGVEVSVFSRALADIRMNDEAVAFYGKISRKEDLDAGQQVPVQIAVNGFTGHGFRLGYRHHDEQWTVGLGVSVFRAGHLMTGDLSGQFTAVNDSDYNFDAEVDYAYYREVIFKRPDVDEAAGLGFSLDLALAYKVDENWSWSLSAEDLLARIRWQDAPFTVASASTDQKSYDEDGYAVFAPLLSGREGYKDSLIQDLDARYYGAIKYQQGAWSAEVRGQYQFGYGYAGIGGGYQFANGVGVTGLFWPEYDQFGFELRSGGWRATVVADQLDWNKVQAISVGIAYGF
jgi:hypothetical protein